MNADERRWKSVLVLSAFICVYLRFPCICHSANFVGKHFAGSGDVEYIQILDLSRRLFEPDPQYQNLAMLYEPSWNGLVEGPNWDAWWIQNSYGTSYSAMPFLTEPWITFLQNSQDLWFNNIGDGKTAGAHGLVGPDGCLHDAVNLKMVHFRQGDGRVVDLHDWAMEFTAAGVLLQSELLLISRDDAAIERYLPKLQRAANFIETRRDPKTGLYLAGPAANLLAPSYAGWKKPDGTYDKAYLAGLSITYVAALDRLIELEKLVGHGETASAYERRRDQAKAALKQLVADEGYFLRSIDPDGTKHGLVGAEKHGYFESAPNHDAIAFRVAEDALAKSIYAKIASIPQLRPHNVIIANYPGYDDMYEQPAGIWTFGQWINGGHWSTCEARMILAYCRLGKFDDVKRSIQHSMSFTKRWRMDAPLTQFGGEVWFKDQPTNITYDAFGPYAAMVRGLFEYLYKSDRLVLIPHIPPAVTRLEQRDPIRFGKKKLYLTTIGAGHVSGVTINNQVWTKFTPGEITLPYDEVADEARIEIRLGYSDQRWSPAAATTQASLEAPKDLADRAAKLERFVEAMTKAGEGDRYETAHARLALRAIDVIAERAAMLEAKQIEPLTDPAATKAADQAYRDAAAKLFDGLEGVIAKHKDSTNPQRRLIHELWVTGK